MRNTIKEKYASGLRHGKYKYSQLNEIDASKKEYKKSYLYSFVIDATSVYLPDNFNKYMVCLQICDSTTNPSISNLKIQSMKALFFGMSPLDLPQISKIGTIIRIHRATAILFHGQVTLNCDITTKGSWALFDLDSKTEKDKYLPLSNSNTSFAWVEQDVKRLNEIRQASKDFLKSYILYPNTISLLEGEKKGKDFDFKGFILSTKESKDHKKIKIKICDETKLGIIKIEKVKAKKYVLEDGKVIRVRCCNYAMNSISELFLEDYSNILYFPDESITAKEISKAIRSSLNNEVLIECRLGKWLFEEYELSSPEIYPKKSISLCNLMNKEAEFPFDKIYNIRVFIINIDPDIEKKWIYIFRKKYEPYCNESEEEFKNLIQQSLIGYKMNLRCKDASNDEDDSTYIILIDQVKSKGFIPQINCGFKGELKKLQLIKKLMLNTNCILNLEVEKTRSGLVLKRTQLNANFDFLSTS